MIINPLYIIEEYKKSKRLPTFFFDWKDKGNMIKIKESWNDKNIIMDLKHRNKKIHRGIKEKP